MIARYELEQAIDQADHFYVMNQPQGTVSAHIADALIAEGWRKKPDASEVARALSLAMAENPYTWEEVPTEMCPDDRDGTTKLVKTLHLNPLVDAILALMDRGQ